MGKCIGRGNVVCFYLFVMWSGIAEVALIIIAYVILVT